MDLTWWLTENGASGTVLLVAVDGASAAPGTYPCRVLGAVSPLAAAAPPSPPEGERIARLLTEVGVPTNLLGYAYLRTALALVLQDGALRHSMTRTLYPRIAEQHAATPKGVERAIRHAIGATWTRSGGAGYRQALGRLASCVGERPTNSEFIAQAAERLLQGGGG